MISARLAWPFGFANAHEQHDKVAPSHVCPQFSTSNILAPYQTTQLGRHFLRICNMSSLLMSQMGHSRRSGQVRLADNFGIESPAHLCVRGHAYGSCLECLNAGSRSCSVIRGAMTPPTLYPARPRAFISAPAS